MPAGRVDNAARRQPLARAAAADHVVRATLLETDIGLSTPLKPDALPAPADAPVSVDATRADVARAEAAALAFATGQPATEIFVFQTLWRLGARDQHTKEQHP